MAHMIDMTNERANIAYRGSVPWHGMGFAIEADDDIDTIAAKAGLTHTVRESWVRYAVDRNDPPTLLVDKTHKMLFRDDTNAPLSIVGSDYNVVQPREVIAFFDGMVKSGGFTIETAGSLSGGKRVWALAKIGDGANVIGVDRVCPYLLAATSYDMSMATIVKYVYNRVVCNNTITAALGEDSQQIKIYHSREFDAARVRQDMGIALNAFEAWLINAKLLAGMPLSEEQADEFVQDLIRPHTKMDDVTKTAGYQKIMSLFHGEAIGSGITQGGTGWQMLNAVTEYVDWTRGRSVDTRMNSAWFGTGDKFKSAAQDKLVAMVA